MNKNQDAYGQAIYDYYKSESGFEIVERDDGFIGKSSGPAMYFQEYRNWPAYQKRLIKHAKGRVLDIGCGAGRHSLYLQRKGLDVLGMDTSPLALKVCRLRGLKKTKLLPVTEISSIPGKFDSIIMLGNNFGLFGGFKRARWLLGRMRAITNPDALILVETTDPYQTTEKHHLRYQKMNRKRGRMSGQLRIRVRYFDFATAWFDYLLVSRDEMRKILHGTGWRIREFIGSGESLYTAVIEKE